MPDRSHRARLAGVVMLALCWGLGADAARADAPSLQAASALPAGSGRLLATFRTSLGDLTAVLFEREAPATVENFVGLATGARAWTHPRDGKAMTGVRLYDQTTFHRVIPAFMIQGGDPQSGPGGDRSRAGTGGPGYRFDDEHGGARRFDRPGILAMANAGPNTNGSQFFITEVAVPHLDGKHTIFGEIVAGLDLIARIAAAGNHNVTLVSVDIRREAAPAGAGAGDALLAGTCVGDLSTGGANCFHTLFGPARLDPPRTDAEACAAGDLDRCLVGALQALQVGDGQVAVELGKRACARKRWYACSVVGMAHTGAYGIRADLAQAVKHFAMACTEGKVGAACYAAAMSELRRKQPDARQVARQIERGCALGDRAACGVAVELFTDGFGKVKPSAKKAAQYRARLSSLSPPP